jgi:hypothetical protein
VCSAPGNPVPKDKGGVSHDNTSMPLNSRFYCISRADLLVEEVIAKWVGKDSEECD